MGACLLLPSLIWRSYILQRDVISEEAHRLVAALHHHSRQALHGRSGSYYWIVASWLVEELLITQLRHVLGRTPGSVRTANLTWDEVPRWWTAVP